MYGWTHWTGGLRNDSDTVIRPTNWKMLIGPDTTHTVNVSVIVDKLQTYKFCLPLFLCATCLQCVHNKNKAWIIVFINKNNLFQDSTGTSCILPFCNSSRVAGITNCIYSIHVL